MKEFFKKFKKADFIIITVILLCFAVFAVFYFGFSKKIVKSPVKTEQDITFTVFLRGVTLTGEYSPFRAGDKTFITIRNVPYTKLEIKDVKFEPRKILVSNTKGNSVENDPATPFLFDFAITVADKAKITDDGAVIGGNKIKIGIPVVLEGEKYKFQGAVSDINFNEEKQP